MTDEQIEAIALPILRQRFAGAGLEQGSVASEEDFDGSSVIRVTAQFEKPDLDPSVLIDALHQIRTELLRKGEERFVFFSEKSPQDDVAEEDVE